MKSFLNKLSIQQHADLRELLAKTSETLTAKAFLLAMAESSEVHATLQKAAGYNAIRVIYDSTFPQECSGSYTLVDIDSEPSVQCALTVTPNRYTL